MHRQTFLIVFVLSFVYGQDRKINSQLNPGCDTCTSDQTLVYVQAYGSKDTIHQVWDFTRGPPTIIYAITSLNSSLSIKWDEATPVKFTFTEPPKYSFAAAIDQIYEYDDIKDIGHFDTSSPQRAHTLKHMSWRLNDSVLTDKEAKVVLQGRYRNDWSSGIVNIKLDILPFKDYATDLPHLIHTANSTLVDLSLVNLTTSHDFNSSRFALHFILVSTDSETDTMRYTMRKSLDDEHTPGVFEIVEIKTPESYRNGDGGFIQYRPVAYTAPKRDVSSSTNTHISTFNNTNLPIRSTLNVFYRGYLQNNLLSQEMFMSFGYGAPPVEGFSLFVIIIISVGLGVPVLLALSGVVYVVARRLKQTNARTRLANEE
ncbi:hypothetical protein K1T71_009453 [Dendrolimus kikuchii]|uniref:Uncharacterized protein n=1 Tax=Dendrolimus kikuchii TaxID=765133 RepID=A0ACC1CW15_9NEOP|nr:hypothetical protein K1T71_009453 [Dendrolimus kikuchii]